MFKKKKILPASSLRIKGDFTINATVTASGNTVIMDGTSPQNIGGSVAIQLGNLTIDNASDVTISRSAITTFSGDLVINSGMRLILSSPVFGSNLYFPGTAQLSIQDVASLTVNEGFYNGNGLITFSGSGVLIVNGTIYDFNGVSRITTPSGSMQFRSGINVQQSIP